AFGDGALYVPARFFPPHHAHEYFCGVEIVAGVVDQRSRVGGEDTRNKAGAHLRTTSVAAGRIKREAADRLAIANNIDYYGDHRGRHFGEIKARIGERRL